MKLHYECECERRHQRSGVLTDELDGYSTDIDCECGAKYVVDVTMLRTAGSE